MPFFYNMFMVVSTFFKSDTLSRQARLYLLRPPANSQRASARAIVKYSRAAPFLSYFLDLIFNASRLFAAMFKSFDKNTQLVSCKGTGRYLQLRNVLCISVLLFLSNALRLFSSLHFFIVNQIYQGGVGSRARTGLGGSLQVAL